MNNKKTKPRYVDESFDSDDDSLNNKCTAEYYQLLDKSLKNGDIDKIKFIIENKHIDVTRDHLIKSLDTQHNNIIKYIIKKIDVDVEILKYINSDKLKKLMELNTKLSSDVDTIGLWLRYCICIKKDEHIKILSSYINNIDECIEFSHVDCRRIRDYCASIGDKENEKKFDNFFKSKKKKSDCAKFPTLKKLQDFLENNRYNKEKQSLDKILKLYSDNKLNDN